MRKSRNRVLATGILTTGVAAEFLMVTKITVVNMIERGEIYAFKIGRERKIPATSIYMYLKLRSIPVHTELEEAHKQFKDKYPESIVAIERFYRKHEIQTESKTSTETDTTETTETTKPTKTTEKSEV